MTKEEAAKKIKEMVDAQTIEIAQDLNLHEKQVKELNLILAWIALTSFNMGEVYGKEKNQQERLGAVCVN
jgi:hypothetical protein